MADIYGQLIKAQLENLASDISSPPTGVMYFNTGSSVAKFYDGSAWRTVADTNSTQTFSGKTLSSNVVTTALTFNAQAELRLADADSSNYAAIKAPDPINSNYTVIWPAAQGAASTALLNDGSGNLSWTGVASSTLSQYQVDIGNASNARIATSTSLLGRIAAKTQTAAVTMTIATPCVVTWTSHGLSSLDTIYFTTTGALPTGVSASTTYYVTVVDANTFKISTSIANQIAGTFVASSGSQSGTHTGVAGGFAPVSGGIVNADINASAAISGSKLQAADTSNAGTVNYYDNGTTTLTFTGNSSGNSTGSKTISYTRVGGLVTLVFPAVTATTTTGDTKLTSTGTLPAALRPTTDVFIPCVTVTGGTTALNTPGLLWIASSGTVTIFKDMAQSGAYTASTCGLYGGISVSYRI